MFSHSAGCNCLPNQPAGAVGEKRGGHEGGVGLADYWEDRVGLFLARDIGQMLFLAP